MLYELLSGQRPFEAKSTAEVISAILTAEPPPIKRANLGNGEEDLVRKWLEKDAALRYQVMGGLISDLEQIRREYESGRVRPTSELTNTNTIRKTKWRIA